MFTDWVNGLEWTRVRPWLLAVAGGFMALMELGDVRTNEGWGLVFDWVALAVFAGLAISSSWDGIKIERARRHRPAGSP